MRDGFHRRRSKYNESNPYLTFRHQSSDAGPDLALVGQRHNKPKNLDAPGAFLFVYRSVPMEIQFGQMR